MDIVEVAEFMFYFHPPQHIIVWNNGVFYSLQSAFDKGLVSMENLEQIHCNVILESTY
jgi:hypothetical protein